MGGAGYGGKGPRTGQPGLITPAVQSEHLERRGSNRDPPHDVGKEIENSFSWRQIAAHRCTVGRTGQNIGPCQEDPLNLYTRPCRASDP